MYRLKVFFVCRSSFLNLVRPNTCEYFHQDVRKYNFQVLLSISSYSSRIDMKYLGYQHKELLMAYKCFNVSDIMIPYESFQNIFRDTCDFLILQSYQEKIIQLKCINNHFIKAYDSAIRYLRCVPPNFNKSTIKRRRIRL